MCRARVTKHEFVQSNECEPLANEVLPVSDPKLVEAVLGEEWSAADEQVFANGLNIGEFDYYGTRGAIPAALDEERARQAALGHRALRLLVNGSAVWSSVEDADAVRAIREELRGGKATNRTDRELLARVLDHPIDAKQREAFEDILGRDRHDPIPAARHHFAHVLGSTLGISSVQIGRLLERDHTTILHAAARHDERLARELQP